MTLSTLLSFSPDEKAPRRNYNVIWLAFFFLVSFVCFRLTYYSLSQGFCLQRITNNLPFSEKWTLPQPSLEQINLLSEICQQKFTYFAKGSQAYAFISEDGQYVLKFVKCYHLQPLDWLNQWPYWGPFDHWKHFNIERRQRKIYETLVSYRLAYERIPQDSALLFMQIHPSQRAPQTVLVQDRIGRTYAIDLSSSAFILQKKARLVFPQLQQWIQTHQIDKAKASIRSLVSIVIARSLKNIHDSDPDLHKNAGLIEEQAIFIDVGSFHDHIDASDPAILEFHLRKTMRKLSDWLHNKSPELTCYLEEEITAQLQNISHFQRG